jgi:hypothetical protein
MIRFQNKQIIEYVYYLERDISTTMSMQQRQHLSSTRLHNDENHKSEGLCF